MAKHHDQKQQRGEKGHLILVGPDGKDHQGREDRTAVRESVALGAECLLAAFHPRGHWKWKEGAGSGARM